MNGLDVLRSKVGSKPPLVPAVPSMHPRSDAAKIPSSQAPEPASFPAPKLVSAETPDTVSRRAQRRPPSPQPPAARPTFAERVSRVQLRADQEAWLRRLLGEAMAAGEHVAEADVLRVALDHLREGKTGWSALREAVLAETRQRARRR